MSKLDKATEDYLFGCKKVDPDYPFELTDYYFDAEGNQLTFGQIFKAGALWLLAEAEKLDPHIVEGEADEHGAVLLRTIEIEQLRKLTE